MSDMAIGVLIGLGIGLFITLILLDTSKSKFYRKFLTNLLVAGKVRQLAEKEKVDLKKEEIEFIRYSKDSGKKRIERLDEQIEEELLQEVSNDLDKAKE